MISLWEKTKDFDLIKEEIQIAYNKSLKSSVGSTIIPVETYITMCGYIC